jgi:hypothetical protein
MRRRLANRLQGKESEDLGTSDFDSVLANCEAVTDGPANVFGEELMAYYLDAKVILNRRRDTDAWHASRVFSIPMWTLSWLDTGLWWLWWNFDLVMRGYYDGDFDKNGKRVAEKHYKDLERSLSSNGRSYLYWSVEQGW